MRRKVQLTLKEIKKLSGCVMENCGHLTAFSKFSTDTRKIVPGSVFIALKGDRFDGHDFVEIAFANGASAVVIDQSQLSRFSKTNFALICVPDTALALGEIAALWRKKLRAQVIALTGSAGKTSTKEILVKILGVSHNVFGTEANNNNHIGVPLTILDASSDTEYLVIEHGTNHFGEIAYTANISKPDYALITNIGASHLEYFGSANGVLKEKNDLLKITAESGGKIFINTDDKYLKSLRKEYDDYFTFGIKSSSDISYCIKKINRLGFPKVRIRGFNESFDVTLPLLSKHNAVNLAAACAVCLKLGIKEKDIIEGVNQLQPAKHRLVPHSFSEGMIIDDSYNANPQSMISAFEVLRSIEAFKNRWVILGDMLELGDQSEKLHIALAHHIMKIKNIRVFTFGAQMRSLFRELKKYYVPVWHFSDRQSLIDNIAETDFLNSVVLVKGSRGMKMEDAVNILLEIYA
jgi:UDP-N-acetylmuramoyl-tripeptide--D-alanyl-D-alanine ligase